MTQTTWRDPYLEGDFAPIADESHFPSLRLLAGEAPQGMAGAYVRNGPNPRFASLGAHHWFDGDGMLHAAHFSPEGVSYRNAYIRNRYFADEDKVGKALWRGLLEATTDNPDGGYKDTANTDIVLHHGKLLTMHYMCGTPVAVDPFTLETLGAETFVPNPGDIGRKLRVSAHVKNDEVNGDLLFFDYAPAEPYMTYGCLGPDGALKYWHPVDLPGARLPHDMAITERFAVLMDLPVVHSPLAAKLDRWIVDYKADQPARFGLAPRSAAGGTIRWFEAEPCYVYHAVNAWESADGRTVTLIAYRCPNPVARGEEQDGPPLMAAAMANLRLRATLYEWVFDLETGETRERSLDDLNAEFPVVDLRRQGRESRNIYAMTIPTDARTLRFDGIVHHDLKTGAVDRYRCPDNRVLSEVGFAPRPGGTADDDGWLVTFATGADAPSELQVFDAAEVARGPVARWEVPQRIPLGFHATWAALGTTEAGA